MGIPNHKVLATLAAAILLSGPAALMGQAADAVTPENAVPSSAAIAPAPAPPAPPDGTTPLAGQPGSGVADTRIFGVLPNYRTANGTLPFSPITTKQKFTIAAKDTFDYPSYILAGAFAGISHLQDSNPSFGQGLQGYAKRYAAGVADQDLGNFMTEAIYPTLLHEDPRYFRKVNGSFWGRFGYAVSRVMVTKTDSGNERFNFSEWLGNGSVAAIGNTYYPDERGLESTLQRMGTQIGTDAISDVLKEFWPDIKHKWFHKGEDTARAGR